MKAPAELAHELAETKALANQAMEELLTLARQLRPTALDDLGLKAALAGHVERARAQGEIEASFEAEGDFSDLPDDVQLVVYRVAQEALSNAARHSGAEHVRVRLLRGDREDGRRRADGRRRRPRLHLRPGRRAASASPACASGRCWSAATSRSSRGPSVGTRVRLTVPLRPADMRRRHGASRKRSRRR